ncbi:MAG TPA: enoyl-CoA hydratase-related protein [Galbitalea sp.]|jgi:enoyl-CoA hydratase|nr:enoyl-CoA hydratase-related protein [Galbitalea sp.]
MTQQNDSAVVWEVVAPEIMRVTLSSPPANALGLAIIHGLSEALDAADAAPDIRLLIIESSVPGFFAAGADIKLMSSIDVQGFADYGDALRATLDRIAKPGRLSIAAVEGVALGGGLELAVACTLRVAGAGAKFGLPEVAIGLIPGAGGTQRLPRLVGRARALDIMLTARQVEASEAVAIGLVDRLVDAGTASVAALSLAGLLLRSSALAQASIVRTVDAAFNLPIADGMTLERNEVGSLFEHGDGREGLAAFVEKRKPNFR